MSSRRNRAAPTPSIPARVGHQPYNPTQPAQPYNNYGGNAPAQPYYGNGAPYGGQPPNYGNGNFPYNGQPPNYGNGAPYGGLPGGPPGYPTQPPNYGNGGNGAPYGGQPAYPANGQPANAGAPPQYGQVSPQTGNPQFSLPEVIAIVDQRLVALETFMARFNEMEAQVLPDSINLILRAARELSQNESASDVQGNE